MKKVITFFLAFLVPLAAFSKTAKRIVCLSPSGAEILCEIGAEKSIVSRTDFCDYPEKIRSVPSIGGFDGRTFSIESILSCKPDFVYGSKGMHDFLAPVLAKHKIELFLSTATSIQDLKNEIQYMAVKRKQNNSISELIKPEHLSQKKHQILRWYIGKSGVHLT